MFTCTCVFKNPDDTLLDVQSSIDLWDKYHLALAGKNPADFHPCPGYDVPWYRQEQLDRGHVNLQQDQTPPRPPPARLLPLHRHNPQRES